MKPYSKNMETIFEHRLLSSKEEKTFTNSIVFLRYLVDNYSESERALVQVSDFGPNNVLIRQYQANRLPVEYEQEIFETISF